MTIAVDTNILVYAHRRDSAFHASAARRLAELANGAGSWAIPWPCLYEFVAITTHPRIYTPPTPLSAALDQVDAWIESPTLTLLTEDDQHHWSLLRALLSSSLTVGPRVHDARIAALCITHRITALWSADRDFSRFPQLRVTNPLTA